MYDWLGPVTDLPPLLIEKGCEDHLTALCDNVLRLKNFLLLKAGEGNPQAREEEGNLY